MVEPRLVITRKVSAIAANGSQIGDVADLQSRKLSTAAELDLKK